MDRVMMIAQSIHPYNIFGDYRFTIFFPFFRQTGISRDWRRPACRHQVAIINSRSEPAPEVMPRCIVVWLLKRWLIGLH